MPSLNRTQKVAVFVTATTVAAVALVWANHAKAADLGGNCCADLEDRIAELEATTARKGNRKVSLEIYGQVNAGLLYVSVEDFDKTQVVNNGNDESILGFAGSAKVTSDVTAGYVLELDLHQLGLLNAPIGSFEPKVRRSYWSLHSKTLGQISVGRLSQATQDFDRISTANTAVVAKPFSLGALSDTYLTGIDVPFDGHYRDAVRYDSPILAGFQASASWGSSADAFSSDGNGDTWDVALRYAEAFKDFKVAAAIGYRHDTDLDINLLNIAVLSVPTGDVNTFLASGSVMHNTTGLFLNAAYADQDWKDAGFTLKGWSFQGGLEQRWFSIGKTTAYGEWAKMTADFGTSIDLPYWGLGVVQAVDSAAMDLYLGWRQYDLGDAGIDNIDTVIAGARIKF